jgi:hypothetical protein
MPIKPLLLAVVVVAGIVANLILAPIAVSALVRRNLGTIERIQYVRSMALSVLTERHS